MNRKNPFLNKRKISYILHLDHLSQKDSVSLLAMYANSLEQSIQRHQKRFNCNCVKVGREFH